MVSYGDTVRSVNLHISLHRKLSLAATYSF